MSKAVKTRVFMSGQSQHVTIPAKYRMSVDEVFVRRDSGSGDLILSQFPASWNEFFAALDADLLPESFLADRAQGVAETREDV